jgi:uncharacterized protein (TIGR03000 family)
MFRSSFFVRGLVALGGLAVFFVPRPAQAQIYETVTLATPSGSYRYVFPVAPVWLGYPWQDYCFNAYTAWAAGAYYGLSPYYGGVASAGPGNHGAAGHFHGSATATVLGTVSPSSSSASLDIRVPEGADVKIDGRPLDQPGARRHYVTPALSPSQSVRHRINATWTENGRKISASRDVMVQAGDRQSILFLAASPAQNDSQTASRLP